MPDTWTLRIALEQTQLHHLIIHAKNATFNVPLVPPEGSSIRCTPGTSTRTTSSMSRSFSSRDTHSRHHEHRIRHHNVVSKLHRVFVVDTPDLPQAAVLPGLTVAFFDLFQCHFIT